MKIWVWILGIVCVLLILAGLGFWLNSAVVQKQQEEQVTTPLPPSDAVNGAAPSGQATTSAPTVPVPTATSTPEADWVPSVSSGQTYQVSYPPDLSVDQTGGILTLTFPKQTYFHWPLQDDAYIQIIATSTCPVPIVVQGGPFVATSTFSLNGYLFTASEENDAAAGNQYEEIAYDTIQGATCYQLDLLDQGANGAGLYVSDQSLIQQYDGQHDMDLANVVGIFEAVTDSFHIVN